MNSRIQARFAGMPLLVAVLFWASVTAQEAPPPAPAEAEEPAVDTSATADAEENADEAQAAEAAAAAGGENSSAEGASPEAAQPAQGTRFRTMDRLELDSTAITGNRELPKVLYIVPWKKADLGDLVGRPASTLLDEVLTPVDREVFRRETEYFSTLEQGAGGSQQPPPEQPAQ